MNVRLIGLFTLRSPLSHIGESISTNTYLVEEPLLQPDGSLESVFTYSGNAWRGQLRDLAATYMLERLEIGGEGRKLSNDTFHLLFSGGRIGGEQTINLDQARLMRRAIPMLALWGGGVGNQILPGKLRVLNCYPLCEEARPVLPREYRTAELPSYRGLTFEKSFSRKDDAKDDRLRQFLHDGPPLGQMQMLDTPAKKEKDGPADQMRMTTELLVAGTRLATEITAVDVSEVELGALVSALHSFSRSPHIGGQANRGHGLVSLDYGLLDLDTGERQHFLSVDGGVPLLAPPAQAAKDAYDQHLRAMYDALIDEQSSEMRLALGVGA